MDILKYLYPKRAVRQKILDINEGITALVKPKCTEKFSVIWYGAYDIDPKYLVYWVCMESDKLKERLSNDTELADELKLLFETYDYPVKARKFVHIGFESQETVNRESEGNWYYHFK